MKFFLNLHKLHPYGDGEVLDENKNLCYTFKGNEIKYLGIANRRIIRIFTPENKLVGVLIGMMRQYVEALGDKAAFHYRNPIFQLNDTKKLLGTLEKTKGVLNPNFALNYKGWSMTASGLLKTVYEVKDESKNTLMVFSKKGFNYILEIKNLDNTLILIMIALSVHEGRVKS